MSFASIAIWIAVGSLLISLGSAYYSARTYHLTYRPYVGVVNVPYAFAGAPPTGIAWRVLLKNTGTLPARVHIKLNQFEVELPGQPLYRSDPVMETDDTLVLMPGTDVGLPGQIGTSSPIPLNEILNRKLPRQADSSKGDWPAAECLGRNVSGGTRPRLSWGRSLL